MGAAIKIFIFTQKAHVQTLTLNKLAHGRSCDNFTQKLYDWPLL